MQNVPKSPAFITDLIEHTLYILYSNELSIKSLHRLKTMNLNLNDRRNAFVNGLSIDAFKKSSTDLSDFQVCK